MSRLDDELKLIYGRKEPSPDFASRVMQQIEARQAVAPPASKRSLWRSILELAQVPRLRFAAAGFAACLFVALVAGQYSRPAAPAASEQTVTALTAPPSEGATAGAKPAEGTAVAPVAPRPADPAKAVATHRPGARSNARNISARSIARSNGRAGREPVDEKALAEGRAAKEKVMLALQIASSTLNEAQRIVQGESRRGDR
ncbi:MAG TPA: hypothetical protein VE262_00985 [Blastocatellia bacterium]|nr:hypothetical protein [Blastocatellia bacterium]